MANIQELDNQINIIEADKELLYDILTNKNIAGLSVLDSLETYVKSVSKLSNYAMYDFNTEADMNKSKSYPIGTYGLVIKEVAEESKYNDSTEDTLYTSFDVPTRVQDINYKKIADNQEIVININTDLGNTVGQLKITSIDARLNIKINTYTVKVQWNRIASEAGEYILSLYEINGVDDYKGGTNYILPEAVDLVLMTEIEDLDLKKSLLKFMPLKNAIYDSLNVYAQTGKWELLFKQLEYEVDTQIKVYNTLEEMNADTVDNYTIGIVLNTEEALRLTTDVVQENRIYKQIILGPEVIINVPKVATRLTYAYSDANDEVTVTLVKDALDDDTRLVVLSSKDYRDAISEVTYSTDITYTYRVKNKVENTDYDVYTFEISSKSTYDSKLGITERVNIDSSEFDRVEIDTPKTDTSAVLITSNNCEIVDGLYGKILYINNNQNNEDNHWEFSGIYMYNGNTWQALALGLNASASTIFTGYKAYTDSGAVTGTGTADANAVATDIMSGKSAYVNGVKIMGTFSLDTELAEQDILLTEQTQDIADVITALKNKIALGLQEATSDANAVAGDIKKDKTAYINGVKVVGTSEAGEPTDYFYENVSYYNRLIKRIPVKMVLPTDAKQAFWAKSWILSIKELDTVTNRTSTLDQAFRECTNLKQLPEIDARYVINLNNTFQLCESLQNFGGLKNLGQAYTVQTTYYGVYTLNLINCNQLTHDSLMNIINKLYDLNQNENLAVNGVCQYRQRIILGSYNLTKLTAEEIAIATNKGWDVV